MRVSRFLVLLFRANTVSKAIPVPRAVLSCARLTHARPGMRFAHRPVPGGNRSHTGIQHSRPPSGRSSHLFDPALSPAMVGRSPRYDHPAPNPKTAATNTVAAIADQLSTARRAPSCGTTLAATQKAAADVVDLLVSKRRTATLPCKRLTVGR